MRSNGAIGKTSRNREALLNEADVVRLRSVLHDAAYELRAEAVSLQQGGR
jgi:hypothetical protein